MRSASEGLPRRAAQLPRAATVVAWALAVGSAIALWASARRSTALGYDLHFSWVAVRDLVHGVAPYSVHSFKYPPSHLVFALPLAAVGDFRTLARASLPVVIVAMAATAVVAARTVGRRWWGLTAALGVLLLLESQPAGDEAWLENVSVLVALTFAVALLLATRERWTGAAVAIGVSLAIKPVVVPVLLLFVVARKWRALAVALAVPAVSNIVGLVVTPGRGLVLSAILHVFTETGAGYGPVNAAMVTIAPLLHVPHLAVIALRLATVALAAAAAWWAWSWSSDPGARLVLSSGALLLGLYLAGTLTEDHFMLTLVPLAVVMGTRGPASRWPTTWAGFVLIGTKIPFPASLAGFSGREAWSVNRCIGLLLVLLTLAGSLLGERFSSTRDPAFAGPEVASLPGEPAYVTVGPPLHGAARA